MDESTRRFVEELVKQQVKEQLELACRPGGMLFPPKSVSVIRGTENGQRYVGVVIKLEPGEDP